VRSLTSNPGYFRRKKNYFFLVAFFLAAFFLVAIVVLHVGLVRGRSIYTKS